MVQKHVYFNGKITLANFKITLGKSWDKLPVSSMAVQTSTKKAPYQSGDGYFCSVIGCSYSSKKLFNLQTQQCFDHKPLIRSECPCEKPYAFYQPKTEDERREWLARLQLKCPPKKLVVCSFHFVDKRPTETNPFPEILLGHPNWKVKTRRVLVRTNRGGETSASESKITQSQTGPGRKRRATTVGDCTQAKTLRQDG